MAAMRWYIYMAWDDRLHWMTRGPWLKHWHIQLCLFGSDS